ncbi:MAG: sulfatase-like hydrolase/transferase, partial [Planctomycetota bacterium]
EGPPLPPRPPSLAAAALWLALGSLGLVLAAEAAIDVALFRRFHHGLDQASVLVLARGLLAGWTLALGLAALAFAATRRPFASLALAGVLVGALAAADALLLVHLGAPLAAQDVHRARDLAAIVAALVPRRALAVPGILLALCFALAAILLWRERPRGGGRAQLAAGLAALALAAGGLGLARRETVPPAGAEARASLGRGLLLDLAAGALAAPLRPPPGYSAAEVACVLAAGAAPAEDGAAAGEPPSLVVLLVDSLVDPRDLGFALAADPIPALRAVEAAGRRGSAVVPRGAPGTVDAELELLTGACTAFLPPGTVAGRQGVRRDLPGLPRILAGRGARARAILADPPAFLDRTRVYAHLGLADVIGLPAGGARGRASDEAVVDAVLELAALEGPFFAFAVTAATRGPHGRAEGGAGAGRVLDAPNARVARELGGYATAVAATDRAIGRLLAGLAARGRAVLVVVLGTHPPLFGGPDGVYEKSPVFRGDSPDARRRRLEVPVWMWASFPLERAPFATSTNLLGLLILETLGVAPGPFLRVAAEVRARHPVFSRLVVDPDGATRPFLAPRERRDPAVRDYELVQHDLLGGEGTYYDAVRR